MPDSLTGTEIRERRKALGLTQGELAELLGVTLNTLARWERDEIGSLPFLSLALDQLAATAKKRKK